MPLPEKKEKYTWNDYQSFPEDERWEIIDGTPYSMSPSPTFIHQAVLKRLLCALSDFFDGQKCELLPSPLDVKLSETDIFQPDLLVVCDTDKIKETHIEGAPDLIIEILSPSSISNDRLRKTHLYAEYGVKEYWLVTPEPPLVEVFSLGEKGYRLVDVYDDNGIINSVLFPKLELVLSEIFTIGSVKSEDF